MNIVIRPKLFQKLLCGHDSVDRKEKNLVAVHLQTCLLFQRYVTHIGEKTNVKPTAFQGGEPRFLRTIGCELQDSVLMETWIKSDLRI